MAGHLWPVRGSRVEGREKEESKHCLLTPLPDGSSQSLSQETGRSSESDLRLN